MKIEYFMIAFMCNLLGLGSCASADACVESETKFDVSFKGDVGAPENLIVVLEKKSRGRRGNLGSRRQELQDDDGFLSTYLAYVQLIKTTTGTTVDKQKNWQLIGFMLLRLNLLRNRLVKIPLPPGDSDFRRTVNRLWAESDNFLKILSGNTIEIDTLKAGFDQMEWTPRYNFRTNHWDEWSEGKEWTNLDLPSLLSDCPSTIASFKLPSNYGRHNDSLNPSRNAQSQNPPRGQN